MKKFLIYHNPRCSKSREVLKIMKDNNVDVCVFEYLKNPLKYEQLKELSSHFSLKDFVRINEPIFKVLGLSIDNKEGVLKAMEAQPKLMQRPIVCYEDRALICRPPEKVLELIK